MTSASDTHDPESLYAASQERQATAWLVLEQDLPIAAYLAGLSVELILQALAHLDGAEHDARHRLGIWLAKCSPTLQETIKRDVRAQWDLVDSLWLNGFRYYSHRQWLAYARRTVRWRSLRGSDDNRIKAFTRLFIKAAQAVQKKGMAEWRRKKS